MLAARALLPLFERITVLERDHFPAGPEPRAGVPQARHVHTLLLGGYGAMEALVPGFDATLAAAGAPAIDWPRNSLVHSQFGPWPRYASDMVSRFASRDLIEHVVRRAAMGSAAIRVEEGCDVMGLLEDRGRVGGVRVRLRGGPAETEPDDIPADLVVDASGRSSHATQWLTSMGFPAPPETTVDPHVGYASRYYRPPPGMDHDWKLLLVRNRIPGTRGGGIYSIEGGRWIVTLGGFGGDYPAQDDEGYLAFAGSLGVDAFSDALAAAEPLGPVVGYRRTVNVWRHFDRMERWPRGFVALGDAVCAFNPVYAQGMSVAALGARLLGDTFASAEGVDREGTFQARLARLLRGPWNLATQEDYRYPETEGPPRSRLSSLRDRYADEIMRAAVTDRVVHRAFIDVVHMRRPASHLGRPGMAARVVRARLRGQPGAGRTT